MREAWTDHRLDDLNRKVDEGFRKVDDRFDRVDDKIEALRLGIETRFDRLHRVLILTQATFIAALLGLFGLQL